MTGLKKLYLEPTSRCNFSCVMCFRHNWIGESFADMSWEVFCSVVESVQQMPSIETVIFGGMGEPLLHPRIVDMVRALSPLSRVEIITNGSLLTKEMSLALRDAGISRVWISIDSFSDQDDQIRPGSRFQTLARNLQDFQAMSAPPSLGFTFVLMKENLCELERINDFADRYRADIINISHMIPCRPLPKEEAIYEHTAPVGKMHRLGEPVLPKGYDRCPFVEEGACFVRYDGEIAPCMQLLHDTKTYLFDIERTLTRPRYGNVREHSLSELWQRKEYSYFRSLVLAFDFPACTVCLGCDDRLENKTDCMHNPFPTCGACLWSSGKVFCP